MELVFANENRFVKCNDGRIYCPNGSYTNILWTRYLRSFTKIIIVARVLHTKQPPLNSNALVTNEQVSFVEIPHYVGLSQYLKKKREVDRIIEKEAIKGRAYICRVPGTIGGVLSRYLRQKNIPYGVEVVGDPWDVFAVDSINHPLRPLIRINGYLSLKKIVSRASVSLYVTKNILQKRYKPRSGTPTFVASNVVLEDTKINSTAKVFSNITNKIIKIISVGSLAQMYKSPDVVLKAIYLLKNAGIQCELTWIGDGFYRYDMVALAKELGVSDSVEFIGSVTSDEVRNWLNKSDLFLLVSRTEGLPRAMIEAMGSGLPCIGSRVGGILELLDTEALVQSGDAQALADKITEFIINEELMNQQAERNLREAKKYISSILNEERERFYNEIRCISKT